jgi:glycosyltransferase involved in cell wall biosynthesis
MDIAFIDVTSTLNYGGIQTAIWQLAIALTDLGHRVTIYGGDGPIRADVGGRDIAVRTFPFTPRQRFPNFGTRFRKFAERWSFARHAKKSVVAARHDWVILTKPFDFFWPRLMPAGNRTRFAFMSGGTDFFFGDRRLTRGIAAWVACSHFNAWQNYAHYKHAPAVIYNGVDTERFRPTGGAGQLRAELGFISGDVVFGFAGRLVGWKGMNIAIRALAEPVLTGLPVKLLIVGEGAARPELQALAASLGVERRVNFFGAVAHDRLPALYGACDAGVFPSLGDEAFGITIAEAMACGLPVVASHNGGIPEVVGNEGSCGHLVGIGDVGECAAAMARLAASQQARTAMGQAARARIERLFTWRLSAERLLAAFRQAEAR